MFKHINIDIEPLLEDAHTNEGHFYRHKKTNILYTSVTTMFKMLDPIEKSNWYPYWINKIMRTNNMNNEEALIEAKRIGKSSTDVGTEMHRLAECHLKNQDKVLDNSMEYEKNPMDLFKILMPWLDNNVYEIYGSELKLYSDKLNIAGTVDLIAKLKTGDIAVIDFKNSRKQKNNKMIEEHKYYEQATAYALMATELLGINIDKIIIVVVSWNNKLNIFESTIDHHIPKLYEMISAYNKLKI